MHSSNGKYKKRKRVLQIFGILNRGGAENRALEFIMRTKHADVDYDMLVLSGAKGVLDKDFERTMNGEIHYIPLNRLFFFRFIKLLRTRHYDVIHSNVLMVSALFVMIAWFMGIPIRVAQLHSTGNSVRPVSRRIRDFFLRQIMLLFATNILPVSESVAKALWGKNWRRHKKIKVVYSGFVINPNTSVSYTRIFKVGHVGRFHEAKNHPFLADVYKELCDNSPNIVCSMVGRLDSEIYPAIAQKLKRYTESGRVIIQGDSPNVYEMMRNLDIMISTSLWEGLPGVVVEAISSGVPVLASNIEPNKEVAAQVKGVRIMKGWDKDEWRDAILAMVEELTAGDKHQLIQEVQESFINSAFYYKNADKELLDVYKAHYVEENEPAIA